MHSLVLVGCLAVLGIVAAEGGSTGAEMAADARLRVVRVTCEYLVNPRGIDVVRPRLSWTLRSQQRGQEQAAYRILVSTTPERLAADQGDLWDSGRVASEQSVHVKYAGRPLRSRMRCYWKVKVWDRDGRASNWSEPAQWSMGLLAPDDWQAEWVGHPQANGSPQDLSSLWLRKTFTLGSRAKRATVYVSSIGYHELYVNGTRIGDYVLSPAVSDYRQRALYLTLDVTSQLKPGRNVIAVWLGRGWAAHRAYHLKHGPLALVQLEVALENGPSVSIVTDATWKAHATPITCLGDWRWNHYGGERYDGRLELIGWNTAAVDDASWASARVYDPPVRFLSAQMVEPDRIVETIRPVGVREVAPHAYVVDMGRNFSGWFEMRVQGPRGRTIRFDYSDRPVQRPGTRSFNQWDEYILRGDGDEVFRNRFNYHGFRWVTVTGLDQKPELDAIRGYLIHSDYARAGLFACSNKLLNRIYEAVLWTYRCLSLGGYVVDCPHRERYGYGAEGQVAIESALYNFHQGALFTKWLRDWRDVQDPRTGEVPHTAPTYVGGGGPAWGGIIVTLPWQMYRHYGDRRILETGYPAMQGYLRWLDTKTRDHILQPWGGEWDFLGDWVAPGRNREPPIAWSPEPLRKLFNNCYLIHLLELTAKTADVLGRRADAAGYREKAQRMRRAVHAAFFDEKTNLYVNGEQPYLAFPLLVGMVPEPLQSKVMANLERAITIRRRGHVNSGVLGTWFLLKCLVERDRNDLVFRIVSHETYPGWGFMLRQGATTLWERWDGAESRIHTSFLSVGSWFTEGVAGIRPDEQRPGFKHFFVRPALVGNLRWARAQYESIHGTIVSDWRLDGSRFRLVVEAPPGTTASVRVPTVPGKPVLESGRPAKGAEGVCPMGVEPGAAVFRIESGRYVFESHAPPAGS